MARWDGYVPRWERWLQDQSGDGCWIWPFAVDGRGYPAARFRGRVRKVSHLVLERAGRPRIGRLFALHSCDTPLCVNPKHLRWGTHQENVDDRTERGRWRVKENHHAA